MAIYLDHNATTPVDAAVLDEMLPYLQGRFGNPSSIHSFGRRSRRGLDTARQRVADLIGAAPQEVVFTSGGTESINHALLGVAAVREPRAVHVITTAIEHQAVLATCEAIECIGGRVTFLGVDRHGVLDLAEARAALAAAPTLVSAMLANNDVGTLQPVGELARLAHERGIVVHTDAVQAVGKVPVDVGELGVDLLSLSSHKLHGPKGVGALYVRAGTALAPLIHGGHQESFRRAGTENVPGIVGLGKACALARDRLAEDAAHLTALRRRLEEGLRQRLDGVTIHGEQARRLPGTSHVGFDGVFGEDLLMALDLQGVAASVGSACVADSSEPSHVLAAMGCEPSAARGSLRLSLGRGNTADEVDLVLEALAEAVHRLRAAG